jgi:hypothetical protein
MIATCDRKDAGSVSRYEKSIADLRGFKKQSARTIVLASVGDELDVDRPRNLVKSVTRE